MFRLSSLFLAAALCSASALASPDYDQIAANLVNESLAVRPGEVIQVTGTPDQLELLAAIQVAVARAGGEPLVTLNIPAANKRALMETPMEYLSRTPTAPIMITRMIDGFINVASTPDPDLFADVPEERMAATRRAATPLSQVFRNANFRSVSLGQTGGIPTQGYARAVGADHEAMQEMFWKALSVSPQQLNDAAVIVNGMLSPGTDVHVTSKAGTNLRFRIASSPARINAGRTLDVDVSTGPRQVWLPAGEAYTTIEPGSAQGKLVVEKAMFRGKPITNLALSFERGRVTNIDGEGAGMLKDFFASSDEATSMLSILDIGLNPYSQPLKGSDYLSWEMGGMVTLSIGSNIWAGGDNNGDGTYSVHIPGATVDVGGARLTSAGELPNQVLAVYKR